MPELPEVETTRRGIRSHVVDKTVTHVLVREPRLRWPVSDELSQSLTGAVITDINRRGKYLLFTTPAGRMMIHLGMSGSLRIANQNSALRRHDHIDIGFADGKILRYHDPRRFGSVFWLPGVSGHPLIDSLGPEPLGDGFDGAYLYQLSRRKQTAVKTFVMNSRVVVGVGNIYANEALFLSGIRPDRAAGRISLERYRRLSANIRAVLERAIDAGGTTLRDFVREDGSPGYFSQQLNVYGRAGEPCVNCDRRLSESRLGSRSTIYCSHCQR